MSKILYFDCETTGLKAHLNGIIQLAFVLEIDGEVVEERNIKMRPFEGDVIEEEALKVNGITVEQMNGFMEPNMAYMELFSVFNRHIKKYDKADKFFPAGFNVKFDLDFLSEFWRKASNDKYGMGSYCNWRSLDPLPVIYFLVVNGQIKLPNYKLATVCEYFGIKLDNAHDAMADIKATIELIKLVNNIYIKGEVRDAM